MLNTESLVEGIWSALCWLPGIPANILTIMVYFRKIKHNKLTRVDFYIIILAVVDMYGCFTLVVKDVLILKGLNWTKVSCSTNVFLNDSAGTISLFLLVIVSVDRYLVVRDFKKPEKLLKRRKDLTILVIFFIITFGIGSLSLFFKYSPAPFACFETSPVIITYGLLKTSIITGSVVTIITCNVKILILIRKRAVAVQPHNDMPNEGAQGVSARCEQGRPYRGGVGGCDTPPFISFVGKICCCRQIQGKGENEKGKKGKKEKRKKREKEKKERKMKERKREERKRKRKKGKRKEGKGKEKNLRKRKEKERKNERR